MRPKLMMILALIALLAYLPACSDDDDDNPTDPGNTVDEFTEAAKVGDDYFTEYTREDGGPINVSAASVYQTMIDVDASNDYFIVDWRSSTHYANGHLEGAINMSLPDLVDNLDSFPTDQVILNVCYTGQTASAATAILNLLGSDGRYQAANLLFGMHGWTYQGNSELLGGTGTYPTEDDWVDVFETKSNAKPQAGEFPVLDTGKSSAFEILKARADLYVKGQLNQSGITSGWNRLTDDSFWEIKYIEETADEWFVLNYFPATNYDAGHIEGAVRYQPKLDIQTSTDLSTLPTDKKILVYCWTGQTSSQLTAYLNMLGYEAYSLLYGVQDLCYNVGEINNHAFVGIADPLDAYPVVP